MDKQPAHVNRYDARTYTRRPQQARVVVREKPLLKSRMQRLVAYMRPSMRIGSTLMDPLELVKVMGCIVFPVVILAYWKYVQKDLPDNWERQFGDVQHHQFREEQLPETNTDYFTIMSTFQERRERALQRKQDDSMSERAKRARADTVDVDTSSTMSSSSSSNNNNGSSSSSSSNRGSDGQGNARVQEGALPAPSSSAAAAAPRDDALERHLTLLELDEDMKANIRAMSPTTQREVMNDIIRQRRIGSAPALLPFGIGAEDDEGDDSGGVGAMHLPFRFIVRRGRVDDSHRRRTQAEGGRRQQQQQQHTTTSGSDDGGNTHSYPTDSNDDNNDDDDDDDDDEYEDVDDGDAQHAHRDGGDDNDNNGSSDDDDADGRQRQRRRGGGAAAAAAAGGRGARRYGRDERDDMNDFVHSLELLTSMLQWPQQAAAGGRAAAAAAAGAGGAAAGVPVLFAQPGRAGGRHVAAVLPPMLQMQLHNLLARLHESNELEAMGLNRDIDSMSYEELLELEERIGNVSKGLTPAQVATVMTTLSSPPTEGCCAVCQEEWDGVAHDEGNGGGGATRQQTHARTATTANASSRRGSDSSQQQQQHKSANSCVKLHVCGHVFHEDCIRQWFTHNKTCPVCTLEVLPSSS